MSSPPLRTQFVSQPFTFSASHELRLLADDHKCRRNHGHNYIVTPTVLARQGASAELATFGEYLDATFDHYLINDRVDFHPTSELLARHLAGWFQDHIEPKKDITLLVIEVSETPSSVARCDAVTGGITISRTFHSTTHGDISVVLGADELDEFGFITDFSDVAPFASYLREPETQSQLGSVGPALVVSLADWFVANVEPTVRSRLESVQFEAGTATATWERGVRS